MTKNPFIDNSDPTVEPGADFEQCEVGKYVVNGIELFFKEDDFPIWKPSPFDNRLQTGVRFLRKDDGPAPVQFYTAPELVLLVRAFGGNVKQLPKNRNTSDFLMAVDKMIKESDEEVVVEVKRKGYVTSVRGADPPAGAYRFIMARARSSDGTEPLSFTEDQFGDKSIYLYFELVGDVSGKSTPFDGYQIFRSMKDPFDGHENNVPKMRVTPNGARPTDVSRLYAMMKAFAPELYEHEWQDADSSEYGICEWENPAPVIFGTMIKNRRPAIGLLAPSPKSQKIILDPLSLEPVEDDIQVGQDSPKGEVVYDPAGEFVRDHPFLAQFSQWIFEQESQAFMTVPVKTVDQLALSDQGREWAKNNLPSIWREAGLKPGPVVIGELDEETAKSVLTVVQKDEGWG